MLCLYDWLCNDRFLRLCSSGMCNFIVWWPERNIFGAMCCLQLRDQNETILSIIFQKTVILTFWGKNIDISGTCPCIRSKGKLVPVHVMKACGRGEGIASLIRSISTRWSWVVSFMPQLLSSQGRSMMYSSLGCWVAPRADLDFWWWEKLLWIFFSSYAPLYFYWVCKNM
jgi:hypothetical protein